MSVLNKPGIRFPGVYVISYSGAAVPGMRVTPKHVDYVGMTVSVGGIRSRLNQFLRATEGTSGHSGGLRLYRGQSKTPVDEKVNFLFAFQYFPAETKKTFRTANDLRTMGHVACLEYYVLAHIREQCGREPRLNRK